MRKYKHEDWDFDEEAYIRQEVAYTVVILVLLILCYIALEMLTRVSLAYHDAVNRLGGR